MNAEAFKEFHRSLIQAHPTFACPVTKEILDVDDSYIVEYSHPSKGRLLDVISKGGWGMLTDEQKQNIGIRIIKDMDQI